MKRREILNRIVAGLCAGVIALSMAACSSSQDEPKEKDRPDITSVGIAAENNYPGPEYELEREVYALVESEIMGYTTKYYDHEFNDLHQLVKVTEKSYKDKTEIIYTYVYDEQGRVVTIKEDYSLDNGGYLETVITYNDKGYKETETFTSDVSDKNGDVYTYTYEYDAEGRPSVMTCTSALTDYSLSETYTYTEKGKLKRIDVAETNNAYIISGYLHDEYGNCIADTYYNAETGQAVWWNAYEYEDLDYRYVPSSDYPQLNTTDQWLYFEEAPFLPTPDSVLNSIEFESARENNGNMIYRFFLSEDNDTARADRYLYAEVIEEVCKCDIYDELIFLNIADSEHNAITETQVIIHWSRTEEEDGSEGRVYIDFCFPTEKADEYDILGIERPDYSSDDKASDKTGYWGADGYYNPTEEEKEENRKEVEKWMKENW